MDEISNEILQEDDNDNEFKNLLLPDNDSIKDVIVECDDENEKEDETEKQDFINKIAHCDTVEVIVTEETKENGKDKINDVLVIEENKTAITSEKSKDLRKKDRCCCSCICLNTKQKRTKQKTTRSERRYEKTKCDRCKICCKSFLAFLFSRIGLCSLVVAYAILGGIIFQLIEAPEEEFIRHEMEIKRKQIVDRLWNATLYNNIFEHSNWSRDAQNILLDFQREIYTATKEKGWDGKKEDGELQWTFSSSLLYSITVITTIGYGNVAPKTSLGRLITIIYAIIGIPLTLLCLANLGSSMGHCFRFLYKHFCKLVICLCCPSQAQWYAKRRNRNISSLHTDIHELNTKTENRKTYVSGNKEEPVRVPIFVSLLLIASYILAGAVIFSSWEEDWNLLIGSYFCFITLSTIGFGDFVPGSNSGSFDNQEKMILCSIYLIFGLSMIAMCFNLMQEEVRAKFKWLGQKIGIIEAKD